MAIVPPKNSRFIRCQDWTNPTQTDRSRDNQQIRAFHPEIIDTKRIIRPTFIPPAISTHRAVWILVKKTGTEILARVSENIVKPCETGSCLQINTNNAVIMHVFCNEFSTTRRIIRIAVEISLKLCWFLLLLFYKWCFDPPEWKVGQHKTFLISPNYLFTSSFQFSCFQLKKTWYFFMIFDIFLQPIDLWGDELCAI